MKRFVVILIALLACMAGVAAALGAIEPRGPFQFDVNETVTIDQTVTLPSGDSARLHGTLVLGGSLSVDASVVVPDAPPPPPPPPAPADCADEADNDGDGLTDFPNDPGCADEADNDEFNEPPPPPPTGSVTCLVSNRANWNLAGTNCAYGTLIELGNVQFHCDRPLSSYGTLPLKIVWTFTGTPDWGDQGMWDAVAGCRGDSNPDTIDVIVASNANGSTLGPCGGFGKFRAPPGPVDIQITGNMDGGPVCGGAHQDVMQIQSAGGNLDIVNATSGNYAAGTATIVGAGGAVFYSTQSDVDVYGGEFVTCNHGFFGNSSAGNQVVGAKFRTGRTDGTDPKCAPYSASDPCFLPGTFQNTTCERWIGGQWVSRPPR